MYPLHAPPPRLSSNSCSTADHGLHPIRRQVSFGVNRQRGDFRQTNVKNCERRTRLRVEITTSSPSTDLQAQKNSTRHVYRRSGMLQDAAGLLYCTAVAVDPAWGFLPCVCVLNVFRSQTRRACNWPGSLCCDAAALVSNLSALAVVADAL